MVYNYLIKLLKKNLYIVTSDVFENTSTERVLERYSCKHPLLTPELIVVNNQPYGFRRLNRRLESLEKFPIQCELEYLKESEYNDIPIIESFELFSEVRISIKGKLSSIEKLCELYSKTVTVERSKKMGQDTQSLLLIYSKLGELLYDTCYEEEVIENNISEKSIQRLIQTNIDSFIQFIAALNEILFKDKHIDELDKKLLP